MKKAFTIILLLCFSSLSVLGQTDMELADYYYNNGDFEQAKLYLEKIYKNNRTNRVYQRYLETLIALNDYEEAEDLAKGKLKRSTDKAIARADLGRLYLQFDDVEKAYEQFDKAIKDLKPGRSNGIRLGNAFIKMHEYDYALKTYQRAKKIAIDNYEFDYEIANLKGTMGDYEGMIESFMDLLKDNPNYVQTVQNSINRNLNVVENEENADLLKGELLKRVQSDPEVTTYNELLIWLFMQRREFSGAFIQAKALDMRLSESGIRLLNLGQLAVKNEDYDTALECYQYLIDKGDLGDYYVQARIQKLSTMQLQITAHPGQYEDQMRVLAVEYEAAVADLGKNVDSAPLMRDLAHVKGFYLNESQEAIDILYETIDIPGLAPNMRAECKLELGNILMLVDRIWDAGLLFSQVELDFKDDALGHEAKLRNAKISYYTGDFDWAQAQLDILKASTSKLISNDAIDLSLLITDNYNMDTTTVPMELYAQADLLAFQGYYELAFQKLDSIVNTWQNHSLSDDIYMLKGDIYSKLGEYDKAVENYDTVLTLYFMDINADDALYKLAELNNFVLDKKDIAIDQYQRIITEFPGSLYVLDARKKFRELRGDEIN